ncbi:MAG: trigger factor [Pseudomonadales bacterium]
MQVTIETTTGLERRLTVGVPASQIDSEVNNRLERAKKTVRIDGFRPGKVPMTVIRQRFGEGVRQEVVGEVMSRSFYEAVSQEKLQPAGQPSIEPTQVSAGKDLEYVATFEVYPEVTLADLTAMAIERPTAEVTDEDVETMIELFRNQQGSWEVAERAAAEEDQVNIDYTGTKDGEAFDGGSAEGSDLVLGSGQMVAGFEDGIVGMSAGEEKTLSLSFPDDYHSEDLKGAAVEFVVKLNSVSERKLAELDAEFFEKYGVSEGGEEEFRAEVGRNMNRELRNSIRRQVKQTVMDQLVELHDVQLPQALLASEINTLRQQMFQQFGGMPEGFDSSLLPDDMFQEQAVKRVSLGLIVREVVQSKKIAVDPAKVRAEVEEIASTYEQPDEVVEYYYSNDEMLQSVESLVLEDQVVDTLLEEAVVEEVSKTYEEVMKPAAQ